MRRTPAVLGAILLVAWGALLFTRMKQSEPVSSVQKLSLPVSRSEFAALVEGLSEPEGYFDTDNFITNETSYLHVIGALSQRAGGGVYFGVGPDQNFSYIVHTDPVLAVIVDIRRQNMLAHLLFKVLIEEAADRVDYLCTLLARDCGGVDRNGDLPDILRQVRDSAASPAMLASAISRTREALTVDYGLNLSGQDLERLEYVHRSFAQGGPDLRFSSFGRSPAGYPTFEEILTARDREGELQSYLSSDALFDKLQIFQRENRLIPVVGDFAGSDAMRRVAALLEERALEISVFYASNVEFYLFGSSEWDRYVENLGRLPFRSDAVFLRAYFPTGWPIHPLNVPGHRPTSLIQDVAGFFQDIRSGTLRTYWDLVILNLK